MSEQLLGAVEDATASTATTNYAAAGGTAYELQQLPDAALQQVFGFLDAPDALRLLSCHRDLYRLGQTAPFWNGLRETTATAIFSQNETVEEGRRRPGTCSSSGDDTGDDDAHSAAWKAKQLYLRDAYRRLLPVVRWSPLRRTPRQPSAREGHLCCLLSSSSAAADDDGTGSSHRIVLTGGYANDGDGEVHVRRIQSPQQQHQRRVGGAAVQFEGDDWQTLRLTTPVRPSFAYGATLTALDGNRAVRFGGFRSGGYNDETCQVALLTVHSDDTARWEIVETTCHEAGDHTSSALSNNNSAAYLSRAYHTATLLRNRYLLVLGGMQSHSSVWNPAVLDTHTWTWRIPLPPVGLEATPTPRHGHSVVFDEARDRLVMFGGGSGSDLLRSGNDNSEVWEHPVTSSVVDNDNSMRWRLLHGDQHQRRLGATGASAGGGAASRRTSSDSSSTSSSSKLPQNQLTLAETLCLGRCHVAHRVSPDTVVLAFGSGRPSTNGLLAYNLRTDAFFRPKVAGPLPAPRFTCASVYLEDLACLVMHSGYSTQLSGTVNDMQLLDLAPALGRRHWPHPYPSFAAVDPDARNHEAVTDADAQRERRDVIEPFLFRVLLSRVARGAGAPYHLRNPFGDDFVTGRGGRDEDSSSDEDDDDDEYYVPMDDDDEDGESVD